MMSPCHVSVGHTRTRCVPEVAKTVDHLLRRPPTDPQLKTPTGDQVSRPGILDHVERVLIPHVDHCGADLDPAGSCPDG